MLSCLDSSVCSLTSWLATAWLLLCRVKDATDSLVASKEEHSSLSENLAAKLKAKDEEMAKLNEQLKAKVEAANSALQQLKDVQEQLQLAQVNGAEATKRAEAATSKAQNEAKQAVQELQAGTERMAELAEEVESKDGDIEELREQLTNAAHASDMQRADLMAVQVRAM